jgi:hypothetical protein
MDLGAFRSALFGWFGACAGKASTPSVNAPKPESSAGGAAKPHTYKAVASTDTTRCGVIHTFFRTVRSFFTGEAPASRIRTQEQSATAGARPAGTDSAESTPPTVQAPESIRVEPPLIDTGSAKPAPLSIVNTIDINREESLAALFFSKRDFSHAAFTGGVSRTIDLWYLHQIVKKYESQETKPDMKDVQIGNAYINTHNKVEIGWPLAPCGTEREIRENLEAVKALMDLGSKPMMGKPLMLDGEFSAQPQDPSQSTQTDDAAPPSTLEQLLALKSSHSSMISLANVKVTASLSDAMKDPALMEQLKQAKKLGADVALEEQDEKMTLDTLKAVKQLVGAGVNAEQVRFSQVSFKKDDLEEAQRVRSTIDSTKVDMRVVDARLKGMQRVRTR